MMQTVAIIVVGASVMMGSTTAATYNLMESFAGDSFFDAFNFVTYDDPTHGYVDFVDQSEATSLGLVNVTSSQQVYIGTEHESVVADGARGRKSIRLESKKVYNGNNIFIIDLEHMPTTVGSLPTGCASWPAFWTCGADWPARGEIDIIEYVNTGAIDATTLHTDAGCDQANEDPNSFTGEWGVGSMGNAADNCDVNAWDQWTNQGCGIEGTGKPTVKVGASFNELGTGGVYALEWNLADGHISAFYFERSDVPADLAARKSVSPDQWGVPYARFMLGDDNCPPSHFKDHHVIFDNTFCGDWGGATFSNDCAGGPSCVDYVKYSPSAFQESYWLVNYVDIYETQA